MQEWLNWHAWKACEPLKGSAGSNPALSANEQPRSREVFLLKTRLRIYTCYSSFPYTPLNICQNIYRHLLSTS